MANTAQARKRARQSLVRRERNVALKSKLRTFVKNVVPNLDMKLIFNVNQFLRTVKKHFHYMYTLVDIVD